MSETQLMESIRESKELSEWVSRSVDGLAMTAQRRLRLAGGCLHLGFDHHDAVILLIEYGIYGSALALLRLMLESYIRGTWLLHCASELDLDILEKKDELDKKFGELVNEIEKLDGFSVGVLSKMKQDSWKLLNSFTHSGYQHIRRRNTHAWIESNYPDQELIAALNFAGAIAILSVLEFAKMAQSDELIKDCYEKAKLFSA